MNTFKYTDQHGNAINRHEWLRLVEDRRNPFYVYPENEDQPIWRYMDFPKFVAMLEDSSIFFPAAARMSDPLEGSVSTKNFTGIEIEIQRYLEQIKALDPQINVNEFTNHLLSNYEIMAKQLEWERNWTYVSCWHMNDHESAAMWRLYSRSDDVIAVKTTFQRLFECLQIHRMPPHGDPKLGKVHYFDIESEFIRTDVHLSTFFYKLTSFEYEKELRAVFQRLPTVSVAAGEKIDDIIVLQDGGSARYDRDIQPIPGIKLTVDLQHLVEKIYISPYAAGWIAELTEKVARRYGFEVPIVRSKLHGPPMYRSAFVRGR